MGKDQNQGLVHTQNHALKIGATAFTVISVVLIIATTFSIVFTESNEWLTVYALFAPLNAYFASLFYGFYRFKKKKIDLVWTILLAIASLASRQKDATAYQAMTSALFQTNLEDYIQTTLLHPIYLYSPCT